MWSVLGGDVWCNQVTSLHEENQPMFNLKYKLFSAADRCLKKLIWGFMITAKIMILGTMFCNHAFTVNGLR